MRSITIFRRRQGLLPHRALSNRLVPAIIAVLVFLLTVTCAGVAVLRVTLGSLETELAGRYTVELPTDKGALAQETIEKTIDLLSETPGVLSAEVVPAKDITRLLEPWLGRDVSTEGLPVPVLIDLATTPGSAIDLVALTARLDALVPGARVEPTVTSLADISTVVGAIDAVATLGLLLMLGSLCAVIVFATGSAMATHARIIELAHQIGAQDRAIAREFAVAFLKLGLIGGIAGMVAAGIALAGVGLFVGDVQSPFLPEANRLGGALLPLVLIPLPVALLTMGSALVTVRRTLSRLV